MSFRGDFKAAWLGAVAVALFLWTGCSVKRVAVWGTADIFEDGVAAFEAEPDIQLAREAAASQLKLLETLHRANPENEKVLLALARSFGSYAFGFLDLEAEKNPDVRGRQTALFARGAGYGLVLLERRLGQGTAGLLKNGTMDNVAARLKRAKASDVPALFWTGYCWGSSIRRALNFPAAIAELPRSVALIERAVELDPNYYYGGPNLFLGVYYAGRPRMAGGDPEKAWKCFSEGTRASGGKYVMTKYLWARYYAVQVQDGKLFDDLLDAVLSAPDDLLPEQRLSQEIAKSWARDLKSSKSAYIVEE